MEILLVDLDSKIPNLALMKISTYHKLKGHNVSFIKYELKAYPHKKYIEIKGMYFDRIYISNIFTINRDKFKVFDCDDIVIGGVGSINPMLKLDKAIENCDLDYSLYPENDKAFGFITRGCTRKCSFCFVPRTEGKLYYSQSIDSIIKYGFKKISFMDNNILLYKKHKIILQELIDKNIRCNFNQGLDIRAISEENAKLLSKLKYIGEYTFAFDNIKDKKIIEKKLKIVKKYIKGDWKIKFYIYHNHFNMDKKDLYDRIKWCKENKVLPYFMRDKNCYGIDEYTQLARWCNQPAQFKKKTFTQFKSNNEINLFSLKEYIKY